MPASDQRLNILIIRDCDIGQFHFHRCSRSRTRTTGVPEAAKGR